jgi:hypothetical protein
VNKNITVILKKHDETLWEIGALITKLTYNDRMNNGASKIDFSFIYDGDLSIEVGDEIKVGYEGNYFLMAGFLESARIGLIFYL